ncbi:MAG: hypothetical protein IT210_05065 [Armatimonadetes bacterium]|nr:hypothetical protein [Armatimonadota bacterium]
MGKVVEYLASYFPILISTAPGLTGEQAMTSAMNALLDVPGEPGTVEELFVAQPDALGLERLVYRLTFTGVGVADHTDSNTYVAMVDAFDGSVYYWDIRMGLPTKSNGASIAGAHTVRPIKKFLPTSKSPVVIWNGRKVSLGYPPILADDLPYIYIGYLCYGAPGSKLVYRNRKQVVIAGGGRYLVFSLNSRWYQINNRKQRMPAKPVIVKGRCYVPLEVAQKVLPFRIRYEAKGRQVCFDSLPQAGKL